MEAAEAAAAKAAAEHETVRAELQASLGQLRESNREIEAALAAARQEAATETARAEREVADRAA